tara:strand:- start:3154 stop:5307 length:2154 start_codon:yes stop_codon:yes gene_type:complete
MPQKLSQIPVTVFNKGLITEAGELTFPDGASVDELNMSLLRDGSRRRRLGVSFESGYTEGSAITTGQLTTSHVWEAPDGVSNLRLLVVQKDNSLLIYTASGSGSVSPNYLTVYDMTARERAGGDAGLTAVSFTGINGELIIASSEINTFKLTYDSGAATFSTSEISFRVRDFEWQSDRTLFDVEAAATVSADRQYDTLNSGWRYEKGAAALATFVAANSNAYPPLTHPWYAGKNSSGDYSDSEWHKIYQGSSILGNGSFIYDLYSKNRASASGLAGTTTATETTRFTTVAAYASRVFYAGMTSSDNTGNVFYSQLLDENGKLGECLQQNDPTGENYSDLLETDGGVINIPQMYGVQRLHPIGPNLLVFATNGVWQIRGIDDSFSPTGYVVNKVTDVGLDYVRSFVSAEGRPYWWSEDGIYTVQSSEEGGSLNAINISLNTVQSFWENVSADKKAQVSTVYDSLNNRVLWMYPNNDEAIDYKCNNILVFDEALKAFYPWKVTDTTGTSPYITSGVYIKSIGGSTVETSVVTGADDLVIAASLDQVVVDRVGAEYSSAAIKFVTVTASRKITFSEFTGTDFLDWGSMDFTSFAKSGYNFLGDLTLKKNVIYLTTYMKVTESTVSGNETDGYTFERPSSCLASVFWDFATGHTVHQQAYRLKSLPIPESAGVFDYPKAVTTSRLRVRGRGRSLHLKFESVQGYDMHLLGYDLIAGNNERF